LNDTQTNAIIQRIAIAITIFLTFSATPQSNIRELCRQRVAGAYLSIFDRTERGKQLLILAETRLSEIRTALGIERKKLRELTQKLQQSPFDEAVMNLAAQSGSTVKQLEAAKTDQESLQDKTRAQLQTDLETIKALKQKLEKVFEFEKVDNSAGYNFRLRYKTACPKFRQSCPLEVGDRQPLIDIFAGEIPPLDCQRYTGILTETP
jgi:hypothetical protein